MVAGLSIAITAVLVASVLIAAGIAQVTRERRNDKQRSTSAFVFHTLAAAGNEAGPRALRD